MIDFGYEIWEETCSSVKKYSDVYGKYYAQLYSFSIGNFCETISAKDYYEKYVKSGAIFEKENFCFPDNFTLKQDGTVRKRNLLSPIVYLYYIAIGKYIYSKNKYENDNKFIKYYGGNFEKNNLHYKESYNEFISNVRLLSNDYNYYMKFDISSFFQNINIRILKQQLLDKNILSETEANVFNDFFCICGNGNMPQIECGTTSSYLSTIIFLEDTDSSLKKYIMNYEKIIDYKIIRYVDDLYIFFNSNGRFNKNKIFNDFSICLSNEYYKYGLSINKDKSRIAKTSKIYRDINSISLIDDKYLNEEINDENIKKIVFNFIVELIEKVEKNGINYNEYNDIVKKHFFSKRNKFNAKQIYYSFVFRKNKWFSKDALKRKLELALEKEYNILYNDPRILTTLILKTEDEGLIKKLLDKLFRIYRSNNWNFLCTYISFIYLLNSDFKHIDLLSILEKENPVLYLYICNNFKKTWYNCVVSINAKKIAMYGLLEKSNLYYLKFLYNIELSQKNYLLAYSYFKNYIDVLTAHFSVIKDTKKKFSIESFYKENSLIKFYKSNLKQMDRIIEDTFNETSLLRNGNPVCHGSCKVLKYNNQNERLLNNINNLNKIVNAYIGTNL